MPSLDIHTARPMLATLAEHPLDDPAFVYEPKYDGIRALIRWAAVQRAADQHLVPAREREDVAVSRISFGRSTACVEASARR